MIDPSPVTTRRAEGPPRLLRWMLALSCAVHVAFAALVLERFRLPDLEIAFEVPIDVELGMTEATEVVPPPPPPVAPEPAQPAPKAAKPGARDAGPEAGPVDGGVEAAAAAADAAIADDGAVPLAAADASAPDGPPATRIPAGQSVALRVDMARVRASPLAGDLRSILNALPDWRALLDGAEIDALSELDLLLVMTPDPLHREPVVIAGRYLGGREVVDRAVQNLARARGVDAAWSSRRGIPVAPWANADATARVIALAGPSHFVIAREQDLDRVLALGAARAMRLKGKKQAAALASGMDGLLALDEGALVTLEVEGAEQYVRRARRGVPKRLSVSAHETPEQGFTLRGHLIFADAERAAEGHAFWTEKRDAYAGHPLVAVLGVAPVLKGAQLERVDEDVRITLGLSSMQARLVLGYLGSALGAQVGGPQGP
jgi:hypothetical protein